MYFFSINKKVQEYHKANRPIKRRYNVVSDINGSLFQDIRKQQFQMIITTKC